MSKKTLTSNLAKWSLPLDWGHLKAKKANKQENPLNFQLLIVLKRQVSF